MNIPSNLGGFQISERLGAGAMGTVYRAVQSSLGRVVVVKTLHPHLASDLDLIARFEREARHAAHLQHQNTVQVFEFGQDAGFHYIAMEYVEGMDLKQILQLRGPFPIPIAMLVLRDVCRGLEAAHARDIVHRDIKPANLMITSHGVVKVMDFGLARETAESSTLTAAGSVMGSPAYMSPEQARGEPVDQHTDIFSTGLVGYEILSGVRAFTGESYPVVLHKVLNDEIPSLASLRPDLPPELLDLIEWMTRKDSAARCPSISDARDLLEAMVKPLSLQREDAILGEFVRAAMLEKELRDPRPKISEDRSTARTVTSPTSGSSDATVVAHDHRSQDDPDARTGHSSRIGTGLDRSRPTPANETGNGSAGSDTSGGRSASTRERGPGFREAEESQRAGWPDEHRDAPRPGSRTAQEARHPGGWPDERQDSSVSGSRDSGEIRPARPRVRSRVTMALSGLAVLLLGSMAWVLLGRDGPQPPGPDEEEMRARARAESLRAIAIAESLRAIEIADSIRAVIAFQDSIRNLQNDNGHNFGENDNDNGNGAENRNSNESRGGNDNRSGNSNGHRNENARPPAPFQKEYSVSRGDGFALIRVDGKIINPQQTQAGVVLLEEGTHTIDLFDVDGAELGTVQYTVERNDPNYYLVVYPDGRVSARPR